MTRTVLLAALALALSGCAAKSAGRAACQTELDAAWRELDIAKAEGFAGTVSYTKALSYITAAKTQQQFEAYEGCIAKAQKARYYIGESRKGR